MSLGRDFCRSQSLTETAGSSGRRDFELVIYAGVPVMRNARNAVMPLWIWG
jgi:hypothetical protein